MTNTATTEPPATTNKAFCLAVLGTGSDVGKSIVVSGLCRIFSNLGLKVAPFKAQNMSNNSGVTPEGLEMGRAQIVQAEAARIAPHTDMNPVLLKPVSDVGSQVVLHGRPWMDATSRSYYERKKELFAESSAALDRLRSQYELIIMEGAGSCAEVNLLENDIVNLRAAAQADAPVILVADIDRGGVFAQIVGTLACLQAGEQARIRGFIINRFRGDLSLFQPGIDWIRQQTGKTVFGVLPWFSHFHIEAEDAVVIEHPAKRLPEDAGEALIAVIRLPHISNFTDFDPLAQLSGCRVVYVREVQDLSRCAAVIIPGSKSTRSDLAWLQESGWAAQLQAYREAGGHILGICGGYQMLGEEVQDPHGYEGEAGSTAGLAMLPVRTVLQSPKTTTRTRFSWGGAEGTGYEIHMGTTAVPAGENMLAVQARNSVACSDTDGCMSSDGQVLGTYLHGLFDSPAITCKWLESIGLHDVAVPEDHGAAGRDRAYQQLAAHTLAHLDMQAIAALLPQHLRKRLEASL